MPYISLQVELREGVDALYVTRPQKERFASTEEGQELKEKYPVVDKKLLKGKPFRETLVMHPLPRVDELAYEVDADKRSMYFKQAARGVPVRMALLAALLGDREVVVQGEEMARETEYPVYCRESGPRCPNPRCVSLQETEIKYIKPEFKIVNTDPLTLRCVYCEHGFEPKFVASSDWHEGRLDSKKYHSADSHWVRSIRPENLIFFNTEEDAKAHGFKPSHYTGGHH
jgi:hypothetical protein